MLVQDDVYERRPSYRYLALLAALLAWGFDGVEQNIYAIMTRPALRDMIPGIADDKISLLFGLSMAMWLWGAAVGGVLFGRLGDRYGRVRSLALAVFVYAAFTGLSALSTHWTHLMIYRFLGATGLGGTWGLCVAIVVETWPERRRPLLAGCVGAAANVGYLVAAFYSNIMRQHEFSWRAVIAVGCFMGLTSIPVILCVPEPTQWRQSRLKQERSSFADLFRPQYCRSTVVGSLLSTVALLGAWGSFLWLATYMDKIAEGTAYARHAGSMVSQYASLGQVAGGFLGGVIAGALGNRKSWCLLCIAAWASVFALFGLNRAFTTQAIVMGVVAGVFVTGFFGWLPKFLPELFPVRIRASGQGFAYNVGRILTGVGALVMGGLGYAFDYRRGAMVMASIYLIGLVIIWFAPDTKGKMRTDTEDEALHHPVPDPARQLGTV